MSDPFAQMHQHMQRMMQSHHDMMGGDFFMDGMGDPFGRRSQAPRQRSQAPVVEEVDDEEGMYTNAQQPIVEEPDGQANVDDPEDASQRRQQRRMNAHQTAQQNSTYEQGRPHRSTARQSNMHNPQMQPFQMMPFGDPFQSLFPSMGGMMDGMMGLPAAGGPGVTSYSYSSSYSSLGGPGGTTYQETKTHRAGPGGVMESQHSVRDGRTGEESMRITRGLGDRQRVVEQKRRGGREVHRDEQLSGFASAQEAQQFDSQWQQHAASALPGYGPARQRSTGAGGVRRIMPSRDGGDGAMGMYREGSGHRGF